MVQRITYKIFMDVDGLSRQYRACALFVMSSGFTGGGIHLIPHADLTDSLLDVAVIHEVGKIELALALQKAYKGQHVDHPRIEFLRAKSVEVKPSKRMVKMIDGDLMGNTPVSIKVAPQVRTVIIPDES